MDLNSQEMAVGKEKLAHPQASGEQHLKGQQLHRSERRESGRGMRLLRGLEGGGCQGS